MSKRNAGGEIQPRITTHTTTSLSPAQARAAKQGENPKVRAAYDSIIKAK
ncbi:hypothetical protein [Streptosporangium lutulentum]